MTDHVSDNVDSAANTHMNLSDAGIARRGEILCIATGQMNLHHQHLRRRRRVFATVTVTIVVGLITTLAVIAQQPNQTNSKLARGLPSESSSSPHITPEQPAADHTRIVKSDSTSLEKYLVRTPPRLDRLTDTELVNLLAEIDRPTGLINMDGQVRLTSHVIDVAKNENDDDPNGSPSL